MARQLFEHFIACGWLRRGDDRALAVTPRGRRELLPALGLG